jgi:hypothetical protein
MLIAATILHNTPIWVFALLGFLIWRGLQARRAKTQPFWRLLIVPLIFLVMGLLRLAMARDGIEPLLVLAWLAAAMVLFAVALSRHPRLVAVDRSSAQVTLPGSAIPLIRNVTVFLLQYGVAVASAMKLQPELAVAILGHAVSGASAGYFSGWILALWRRYRGFDTQPPIAAASSR